MIVVDLGCHNHPGHHGATQDSIGELVRRYKPHLLLGFDPHPDQTEGVAKVGKTMVVTRRMAASISDAPIPFRVDGLSSGIHADGELVEAFDVARLLRTLPGQVILKLDVEGSEYLLLPHLIAQEVEDRVGLLLVEWHDGPAKVRSDILWKLRRCQVEDW